MKNNSHHYVSINAIESAHKGHFFDADSKRFFASHISGDAFLTPDKQTGYFVTSEQFRPSVGRPAPRLYSVRSCNMVTGDINTVDGFQGYTTGASAKRAALKLAQVNHLEAVVS